MNSFFEGRDGNWVGVDNRSDLSTWRAEGVRANTALLKRTGGMALKFEAIDAGDEDGRQTFRVTNSEPEVPPANNLG